ncbi:carotenoid biosynthesis protein [Pseudonocardia sp. T1-2H]|uniref:carotenoid biosynthesis protein n=1 Tax=Pseudonocardia sp. T1-2H TaxID=3128899 RepID=UPI0031015C2B
MCRVTGYAAPKGSAMLRSSPALRRGRLDRTAWMLVAAAVLTQILYPLTPQTLLVVPTVVSVVIFAAASLTDAARRHGARGAVVLLVVAGGGGLAAEAMGVATGLPFGAYAYTGSLGAELFDVPVIVPLAWIMMAWPALVVGRSLVASSPVAVAAVGGVALAAWDVFLDPQMVDAGHWRWTHPSPSLPLVPGIPLSNYAGWLVVSVLMIAALDRLLGRRRAGAPPSGPAAALYLWVYASSVLAHLAFFGLPGSALAGGVLMGLVAVPFARVVWRAAVPSGLAAPAPPRAESALRAVRGSDDRRPR